jgi:tRNA pseudouridine55 synthase
MATGLLVLGVGPSTRLLRFAQSEVKRYRGTVRLGIATDSLDAHGAVVDETEVPALSEPEVQAQAIAMLGVQLQVPPMVSALKVGGHRLHKLARQGLEVERVAREITINEFALTPTPDPALWEFEVECSVGTYVRVLLSDLAVRLGTIGHLSALRRLSSGQHHVDQARTLEELEGAVSRGEDVLRPPGDFVTHLARVTLDEDQARCLRMGQQVVLSSTFDEAEIAGFDARGALVAILSARAEKWKPELVLPDDGAARSQ